MVAHNNIALYSRLQQTVQEMFTSGIYNYPFIAVPSKDARDRLTATFTDLQLQEHTALLDNLWGSGSGYVIDTSSSSVVATPSRRLIFGADEIAGDREIEFFIAEVLASNTTAAVEATLETAAADACTSMQHGAQTKGSITNIKSPTPVWLSVTLRAVPWHAGDPQRRYNPYHLRIIGRELSHHGSGATDIGEDLRDSPENAVGSNHELGFERPAVPGHMGVCYGDGDCHGGRNKEKWTPGFEREGSKIDGKGERHAGESATELEIATFSARGVTYVDLHGETSFFTLEEWCLEKRRFDAMSRMKFCSR